MMCSDGQPVIVLPESLTQAFRGDGYLQEYRSMEDYQRERGGEKQQDRIPSVEEGEPIYLFLEELVELCKKHKTEMNGCFAVSCGDELSVRNIEHISNEGVIRTISRGNRL